MLLSSMFNFSQFLRLYGTDEKCLKAIWKMKYPNGYKCHCGRKTYRHRKDYQCSKGHQTSILKGTVFESTNISLVKWFYVMFLMSNTRSGVSAGQIHRELGITYKTAWKMMRKLRTLMSEDFKLEGDVEV